MTNIRITRHPNGQWVAIGAIPLGASLFTIKEITDERPFKRAFLHRFANLLAPQLREARQRTGCIAGVPGSQEAYAEVFTKAIAAGRKAAEVFADRKVREDLMQKISKAITVATNMAEKYAKQVSVSGSANRSKVGKIANSIVNRILHGDATVYITIVDLARRTKELHDPKSRVLLAEVINQATLTPAGNVLRDLFVRCGCPQMVAVVEKQAALHHSRAGARVVAR